MRRLGFARFVLAFGVAAAPGCARDVAPPPARPAAPARPAVAPPRQAPPEGSYWDPVEPELKKTFGAARELPLDLERLASFEGATRALDRAPAGARAGVTMQGFVVGKPVGAKRPGAFYVELRERNVPYVVTFDALLQVAHVGVDRALAELERRVLEADLPVLLERIATRLDIESVGVGPDLLPGFRAARGLIAVARVLLGGAPPADLAPLVQAELALVRARSGPRPSPILGVTVDYSLLPAEPRGGLRDAVAWLGVAPLVVLGRSEAEGAPHDVGAARVHARAAMLLARAVDPAVDAQSHAMYTRLARLGRFVAGPAEDVGLADLAEIARKSQADLRDPTAAGNVAKVDRVRAALQSREPAQLYDGAGEVRVRPGASPRASAVGHATLSVRALPLAAAPDARVLQSLVFPVVGPLERPAPPPTARDGLRALPSSLDVGAWLGSPDARAILHDTGDDAYQGYGAALSRLLQLRAPSESPERHASFYASMLDALGVYLAPSAADRLQSYAQAPIFPRRKLETALAGWTLLRHDQHGSSRPRAAELPRIVRNLSRTPPPPAFVEPHPEAIGRLLAALRQLERGLVALGGLPAGSAGAEVLQAAIAIVAAGYEIAIASANDDAFTPAQLITLAELPSKIAELEALVGPEVAAPEVTVDVHTDLASARGLVEATGPIEEAWMAMRDPGSPKVVVAVGVALPHFELTHPSSLRMSDARYRARLDAGGADPSARPARMGYARAYRFDDGD